MVEDDITVSAKNGVDNSIMDLDPSSMMEYDGFYIGDNVDLRETLAEELSKIRQQLAKIDKQIERLNGERAALLEKERGFAVILNHFGGNSTVHGQKKEEKNGFGSLTIANAAALLFRDQGNSWATVHEIERSFKERGKTTTYNAIDLTLKENMLFERKKENGRNYFRLNPDVAK